MTPQQWNTFRQAAKGEPLDQTPLALIIDSPWIPGHVGVSHLDFYLDPEVWFRAHQGIHQEFPEVIFVPGWWMEYGMAAEPSVLGAKIKFWPRQTPSECPRLMELEDLDQIADYDVNSDAFMAFTLHRIRMQRQRILDCGQTLPIVTARGPVCTAGFLRGTTELMMDLIEDPEATHRLLDLCTRMTIDWLKAQAEAAGPTVEGIFLLDDIVGFVGESHYLEFCHPYLKRICDAFPGDWVKIYHNDASIEACLEHLPDVGFDVLNWGKQTDIADVKRRIGNRMTLMGNVNPLEIGVRGTPDEVRLATREVLVKGGRERHILSLGGGVSPGMPKANILAMIEALEEFNAENR